MEADEPIPTATVVKPPNPVSGVLVATLFLIAIGTAVGFALAMLAAFIVVHLGLPADKLVVGMPLIVVGGLAWATTKQQTLRDAAIAIVLAGVIAGGVIAMWKPASPASLFTHESKVTDVQVHGTDATMTLESKTRLTAMPPLATTAGYALLLACFALIATTIANGAMTLRKPKPF